MSKAQFQGFFALARTGGVVRRSLKVTLIVGTILALINHADALINGTFAIKNALQILLTYLVPYGVATYSAVNALQENARQENKKRPH